MKHYILQLFLVVVLLSSCAPKTDDEIQPVSTATAVTAEATSVPIEKVEVGKMLDGQWSYECDELGFNRYTWTSPMQFAYADMIVEIAFDELDILSDVRTWSFSIISADPYYISRLYIMVDGSFNPKMGHFEGFELMNSYPGGYSDFEKELIAMDVDWVNMYLMTKAEFLSVYIANNAYNEQCAPVKQFDTQSG